MRIIFPFLALVVLTVACGDSPTEPDPTVTGSWRGTGVLDDGQSFGFNMTLIGGNDGSVTGSGSFSIPGSTIGLSFTVSGTHDFPDISLVISVPGTENAFLNGESTGTRITAELTGSGFDTQTIVFTKTGTGT